VAGEPMKFLLAAADSETDDCILWPFALSPSGYGAIRFQGRQKGAHRHCLQIATGITGEGLDARHGPCQNRSCINPRHLSWGTPKENSEDRVRDGTMTYGAQNSNARLTEQQVLEIVSSTETLEVLSQEYGVSFTTIHAIRQGRSWSWLTGIQYHLAS
jgi:hypothetical protein